MRRALAAALIAAAVLAARPAGEAGALVPGRCVPDSRDRVVLQNRAIRVISWRDSAGLNWAACDRATGDGAEMADASFDDSVFAPPAMALAGRSVAFAAHHVDSLDGRESTRLHVYQHRRPPRDEDDSGWRVLHSIEAGRDEESKVGAVVVRPNGAVAWISCPMKGRPGSPAPTCTGPGHDDAVWRIRSKFRFDSARGDHRDLLDRGRGIDPRSLRRVGDRIYWRHGGRTRSASLR